MDKFHISYPNSERAHAIGFDKSLVFMGSCFSDDIGEMALEHGFNTLSNPFGTLFHPDPILACLKQSFHESKEVSYILEKEYVSDWNSAHVLQSNTKDAHLKRVLTKRENLKKLLSGPATLFITLGTSIGYRHKTLKTIVANCHKQPSSCFIKESTSANEMYEEWAPFLNDMLEWNPLLNIVFTISPVRHIKDGLVSNTRSKARLIVLIEMLIAKLPVGYFPSYEIVQDALRDYRFYKKDMVHPNEVSISEIWGHFLKEYTADDQQKLAQRIFKLNTARKHRAINTNKVEAEKFEAWMLREEETIEHELKAFRA